MKKWTIGISLLLLLGMGYMIASIFVGMDGKKGAEEQAIQIAKNEGKLVSISDYYLYNGKDAYSVVVGKDQDGTKQVLWIPKNTKEKSATEETTENFGFAHIICSFYWRLFGRN